MLEVEKLWNFKFKHVIWYFILNKAFFYYVKIGHTAYEWYNGIYMKMATLRLSEANNSKNIGGNSTFKLFLRSLEWVSGNVKIFEIV